MATANDTVRGRMERARIELTPARVVLALAVVAVVGAALLFAPEPALHDAMHEFRHAAGITCH